MSGGVGVRAALGSAGTGEDDEVAPEVPTSFATKGVGWSGREKDDLDVVVLNDKKK